jgi:hypothetical protein
LDFNWFKFSNEIFICNFVRWHVKLPIKFLLVFLFFLFHHNLHQILPTKNILPKLPIEMFHCYFHQKITMKYFSLMFLLLFANFFIVNLTITNLIILIFFFFKSNKLFTWSLFIKQPRTKLSRFNLMNETSKKKI